jgi:hypothetical protein
MIDIQRKENEAHLVETKVDRQDLQDTEDSLLLAELLEISNRSASSRFQRSELKLQHKMNDDNCTGLNIDDNDNNAEITEAVEIFLHQNNEKVEMNQFWYSTYTIQSLCAAIGEVLDTHGGKNVAFLSTPSLYFAFPDEARKHCCLFDVSFM